MTLEQLANTTTHTFSEPIKRIEDGEGLQFFFASKAYRDLATWLSQLNRAMFPSTDGEAQYPASGIDSPLTRSLRHLLDALGDLVSQAPPETGPRRFGNAAFRKWYQLADDGAIDLLQTCLGDVCSRICDNDSDRANALLIELKAYLMGSFGSAQRLDYGTGHELSFVAFLGCLWKLSMLDEHSERAIVVGIIQPYLELIRRLILTYNLEPAGSHGVWGLDDHSFVPYIFGSAQFGPAIAQASSAPVPTEGSSPNAPSPSLVTDKASVLESKDTNMYFSAIQFIYDVKKGPFWEHSPILYDISGIKDGWGKINKGLMKMYAAEVLGKFPVVQHFPFGSLFEWERDPSAFLMPSNAHVQHQPAAIQKPAPSGATSAPWARQGDSRGPQLQASTGVPTSRMPPPTRMPPPSKIPPREVSASSGSNARPQASDGSTPAPWAKRGPS